MKKLLMLMTLTLLFSSLSSAYIYDNFGNGINNWNLWRNNTTPYPNGQLSVTESSSQMIATTNWAGAGNGDYQIWSENLTYIPYIKSVNLSIQWNIGTGSGADMYTTYQVFNQTIFTVSIGANSGSSGLTTISLYHNRLTGKFEINNGSAWNLNITPTGRNIYMGTGCSGSINCNDDTRLGAITFELYNVWNNLTSPLTSSSTTSYGQNFTVNSTSQFTYNLTNITYYFYHSNFSLAYSQFVNITNKANVSTINRTFLVNDDYTWFAISCGTNISNHECYTSSNSTFKNLLINNVTYNSSTIITRTEGYILNLSLTNPAQLSSATFVFNNVSQSAPYTIQGNEVIISNSKTLTSSGTAVFYWSLNIGGQIINTTSYTQSVSSISSPLFSSTQCSGGGYSNIYNFSVYEETNLTQINSTQFNYVIYYGLTNGYSLNTSGSTTAKNLYLCLNFSSTDSWKIGYGEINYQSEPVLNYPLRKYLLFQNTTIINGTNNNVSLYSIPLSQQTSFDLSIIDRSTLLPYAGYYIALLRWYPSTNEYRIVDMGTLDDSGQTPIHVIVEDVDYRVAVYSSDGTLIHLANPRRLICLVSPCEYTLSIEGETINLNEFLDIQNLLSFNSTTGIWTFIWNDPSQRTSFMNLTVYQDLGDGSRVICSTGSSAYTGIITCNTSGYDGKLRGEVKRSASPPIIIAQLIENIFSSPFKSRIGLFITFFMSALIIFAVGYISPVFAVLAGIISLIPALYLGSLSYVVISALAGLGGVILHVLNRT